MEDDEITDALVPILLPHLDLYPTNDPEDEFLLVVMDENGARSKISFSTIQILDTEKLGQQQIGLVYDAGQQMRADYNIVVRVQAIGAKASQRIRNLRTALEYDSTGDKLAAKGLGYVDSSTPTDVDGEKNTLFEHRTVFDITFSACVGNFNETTFDAATDFGKLGRPLFDEEVVPVEKVTITGDSYPDGKDTPIETVIDIDITP